ncbi:MAG: BlaI/MecI/CopY family transcriptional regulator [Defluviitaleaceae bacterium]|nr:BlaI/MecI/CopY family transcriptional regulator [Defluviitaleaceae bacterium]
MKKLGRLSETEMEVMQVVWEQATPITVAKLLDLFAEKKGWKTSTLSTILSRLIQKGFLTKTMKAGVNYYNTDVTLYDYQKSETRSLLTNLYGGNVKNYVAALVDNEGITNKDIEDLKHWFKTITGDANE